MIAVAVAPFGALFGALAHQNGVPLGASILMSATIYAGASQLVGLQLFGHDVPAWLVVLSILAVNFRHVLYSAALTEHLGSFSPPQRLAGFFFLVDPQFAEAVKRAEGGRLLTFAWYMGVALPVYVVWIATSAVGALLGGLVGDPKTFGLDVLLPAYFLALVLGFRRKNNFLPVVVASAAGSILAYRFVGSPWHVSLGALLGVAVAAARPAPRDVDTLPSAQRGTAA